jgi:Na+/phosphate symporter
MFGGTISITGIMLYIEYAESIGKSGDYIQALNDLIEKLRNDKEEFETEQKKKLEKLNKRRTNSISSEPVSLYYYERKMDNTIRKREYKAIEKKNSYELINCWRVRLSKNYDINRFTDMFKREMWTDTENDELMEELLSRYEIK